jgi:AraC family transcriptional regulator
MKDLDKTEYDRAKICIESFKCAPELATPEFNAAKIGIHRYSMGAGHTPEHAPKEHAIIILHEPLEVKRRMGGKLKLEHIQPTQNVIINPVNVPHESSWSTQASFSLMFLDPKLIAYAWTEFIDPDEVEILPHFSLVDPTINRIATSLHHKIQSGQLDSAYEDWAALSLGYRLLGTYGVKKIKSIPIDNLSQAQSKLIVDYIRSNLARQISLDALSSLVGMSSGYFGKVFKQSFGTTPSECITGIRLEEAARLLKYTKLPISRIAGMVGIHFDNLPKFFKRKFKVSPSEFRRSIHV